MTNGKPKMQSWQILHFARKHLGRSALYIIFGRKNARIVDYWCEDPKTTDKKDQAYDPIQGVKDLLSALDDQGHTGIVRACLAFLRSGTSLEDDCLPAVTELLPTMAEEELADYHAVAAMQHAIDQGKPPAVVSSLKKAAVEEIERTYAKYLGVAAMLPEEKALLQEVNANLKLVLSALGERPVQTYLVPEIPPSELARLRKKHGPQVLSDFNAKQGAGR